MNVPKILIIFSVFGYIKSEDDAETVENCSEDIRALRMELATLRGEVLNQKEEIKELRKELARKPDRSECLQTVNAAENFKESVQTPSEILKSPKTDEGSRKSPKNHDRSRISRSLINPAPRSSQSAGILPRIAFHANSPTDNTNLAVHQNLNFGNVISNVGNKYHHATGIFIPDVSGMYVFYVQIISCSNGHEVKTEIIVEGVSKGGHYAYSPTGCANGGGMTIVHVNAGDSVWVRLSVSDGTNHFGWESSFSGFLLYADE
ncbi:uncharacterized protein LOC134270088 [Saccostrea cucullata]|uniref:uncharacterized protein LOC134270088 n=1 Tax=Saccostrea cuccullata TaxID=36930 RepID=UPI002ED4B44D